MPYLGTLSKDVPFTFELICLVPTATTWYWLKPGRIVDVQGLTSDPTSFPIQVKSPMQADRLVIEGSTGVNVDAVVRLSQGATVYEVGMHPDAIIQVNLA